MILFLGICLAVVGSFFIIGFGGHVENPQWHIIFTCAVWGGFCGGLARYIKDKEG